MTKGTKVVCVDAKFPEAASKFYIALPVKDKTYVIRDIAPGIGWDQKPEIAIWLIGLHNPKSSKSPFRERGFNIERFRPLDEVQAENSVSKPVEAYAHDI